MVLGLHTVYKAGIGNVAVLDYENSSYFVFEPGIGVELNVLKFFRIELGASYRIVTRLNMPISNTKASDVDGYSVNFAFKFGKF